MSAERRASASTLASLALLYTAQGIPYGLAAEYVPVVLREQHYSLTAINAVGWLQLPWQLKVLWAKAGDHPRTRPHARSILLFLQLGLAGVIALGALRTLPQAPALWFTMLGLTALLASTQDVFVDALAVRSLGVNDRGWGNIAQVAGYRLGMLAGGAGLLVLATRVGSRATIAACAAFVVVAGLGAFAAKDRGEPDAPPSKKPRPRSKLLFLLKRALREDTWRVAATALGFKMGLHVAGALIKPMCVDAGWTKAQIGWAVVTVGTVAGLLGAAVGGVLHRTLGETRALVAACAMQAVVCLPLLAALQAGVPRGLTTGAIAVEHFTSGAGTTVLFAALMSATRKSDAGLHYTILTSLNALGIGLAGIVSGLVGDLLGKGAGFALGGLLGLVPLIWLNDWSRVAATSAHEE
jgi:MFS family permease